MSIYTNRDFHRWYRSSRRVRTTAELARDVALAVALTERALERTIRSVLDVGAGEGAWRSPLRKLRRRVRYVGVDPSDDAIRRFGTRRNLRWGTLAALPELKLDGPFDLVICADVLHYLDADALRAALRILRSVTSGLLYAPIMTRGDDPEGDRRGFRARRASFYRATFHRAGLVRFGAHGWVATALSRDLDELMLG